MKACLPRKKPLICMQLRKLMSAWMLCVSDVSLLNGHYNQLNGNWSCETLNIAFYCICERCFIPIVVIVSSVTFILCKGLLSFIVSFCVSLAVGLYYSIIFITPIPLSAYCLAFKAFWSFDALRGLSITSLFFQGRRYNNYVSTLLVYQSCCVTNPSPL